MTNDPKERLLKFAEDLVELANELKSVAAADSVSDYADSVEKTATEEGDTWGRLAYLQRITGKRCLGIVESVRPGSLGIIATITAGSWMPGIWTGMGGSKYTNGKATFSLARWRIGDSRELRFEGDALSLSTIAAGDVLEFATEEPRRD